MSGSGQDVLVLHMAVKPFVIDAGTVAVSAKYLEVLEQFGSRWPGEVRYLAELGDVRHVDMDVELALDDFPVTVVPIDPSAVNPGWFPERAMVLAGLEWGFTDLHRHVSHAEHRVVRGSDYPPSVERRIMLLTRWRRPRSLAGGLLWVEKNRRRCIRELQHSAALQSQQYASYDEFEGVARERMVFIDTRIRDGEAATPELMASREQRYRRGDPLHLCFAGRLDAMKSPLDIARVARALRDRGVPFHYSVFGDGPLREPLERRIREEGLSEWFTMHGFVDLRETLMPFAQQEIDVFVGQHRQGDTSTTYPEMMAHGVPVVSYPNKAVRALQLHHGVSTLAARMRPDALADVIAAYHEDREALCEAARRDHEWGRLQTIEAAHQARIDHVLDLRTRYHRFLDDLA